MTRVSLAGPGRGRPDVSLAPLRIEHAAATFGWVSDPEVARNLGLRREPSMAATEAWITATDGSSDRRAFAIRLDATHVGNVVLDQIDSYLRAARLSIYIGEKRARGAGVGRSAVLLALAEAFGPMGLNKVWLTVHARNVGAAGLYAKVGFALEGVLRDEFVLDGELAPALRMGIVRAEFERAR